MDTSEGGSQDPASDDDQGSGTDEEQLVNTNTNRSRARSESGSSEDEVQPSAKRRKIAAPVPSRRSGTKRLPKKPDGRYGRAAAGGRRAPCRRKQSSPRRRRASPRGRRARTTRNTRRACAGRGARRRSPARRRGARSPSCCSSSSSFWSSSSCSSRGSSRTSLSSVSRSRSRGRSRSTDSHFDIPLFVPQTIQDFRFDTYIRRMQKKTCPKLGMQCDSVRLMDNFLKDILHMITLMAASRHMGRRKTLQPKIIQKALKKILPRGMWEGADEFGMEAVDRYCKSTKKNR